MNKDAVLAKLVRFKEHYDTDKEAAEALGVSGTYVKHILDGKVDPGPKLLKGLGLELVKTYRAVSK